MLTDDLSTQIAKYSKKHPEFHEILKKFHMTQDLYERILQIMYPKNTIPQPATTQTTEGEYIVDVSATT